MTPGATRGKSSREVVMSGSREVRKSGRRITRTFAWFLHFDPMELMEPLEPLELLEPLEPLEQPTNLNQIPNLAATPKKP